MSAAIRVTDTGADAFLDDLDALGGRGSRRFHHAEIGNDATDERGHSYPVYLDAVEAYDVINDEAWLDRTEAALDALLAKGKPLTDRTIREALTEGAEATIRYLQSYAGGTAAPVRAGGPRRPLHPTGLADRTRRLVNAYFSTVDGGALKRYPTAGAGFTAVPDGGRPF